MLIFRGVYCVLLLYRWCQEDPREVKPAVNCCLKVVWSYSKLSDMWTSQQFRRSSRVRWFTRTIYCVLNITWGLSECLPSCLTYQICSYKAAWWKWTPNTVHGSEIWRTWTTQNPLQTLWATFHHMQHLHLWSISSQQKVSYISIWWLIACQVCMVPDIQGIKVGAPTSGFPGRMGIHLAIFEVCVLGVGFTSKSGVFFGDKIG